MIKLISKKIESKTENFKDCEDEIVFNNNFVAVIDGTTTKGEEDFYLKPSGKIAANLISKTIKHFDKKITLKKAIQTLSEEIKWFYKTKGVLNIVKKNPKKRLTASVIIYSKFHDEVWMIGDCQCIINNKRIENSKKIDEIMSKARSLFLELEMLCENKTVEEIRINDTGRDFIKPLLNRQKALQNINHRFGYEVVDGFKIDINSVKRIKRKKQYQTIILASDGHPKLFDTLEKSEEYLKEILRKDPLCFKHHKSTKGLKQNQLSFDDRAYIKFKI